MSDTEREALLEDIKDAIFGKTTLEEAAEAVVKMLEREEIV